MRLDLECVGIRKSFAGVAALAGVDLLVGAGSFFALVGPSGCGKSTLLRIVGGHETADAGTVLLRGVDVSRLPPERRPVHTVFQQYALFPHLSVEENVAFSLRMSGVARRERRTRANEALALVRLSDYGRRRPATLSGGEKQRVALARALVGRPAVLLLDEPLGALDLQLRHVMQDELRDLQRRVGLTFLHVTHDQEEAFRLADRVAILRKGLLVQEGAPRDVYRRPATPFVASFLGVANLLAGRAESDARRFRTTEGLAIEAGDARPGAAFAAVREERVHVHRETPGRPTGDFSGQVVEVAFLGASTRISVQIAGLTAPLHGVADDGVRFERGDRASVSIAPEDVLLLPAEPT